MNKIRQQHNKIKELKALIDLCLEYIEQDSIEAYQANIELGYLVEELNKLSEVNRHE